MIAENKKDTLVKKVSNLMGTRKSLKSKLTATYVMIALIPIILISSLTYFNNKRILTKKVSDLANEVTSQKQLNIDSYLSEIENATSLVFANDEIMVFNPARENLDGFEKQQKKSEIEEYLLSISLLNNFTDFSLVYENNETIGKISETTNKLYDKTKLYNTLKEKVTDSKSKSKWFTGEDGNYNRLYYAKQVNDKAIIITSIYTNELEDIFTEDNDENGTILRLCTEDNIIYSSNEDEIASKVDEKVYKNMSGSTHNSFEANGYLISSNSCENGWTLVNSIPKDYILKEIEAMGLFSAILTIVCIIAAALCGVYLAKKISNPINDLVIKMKEAENGDLTVKTDVKSEDEIGVLGESFNVMMNQISMLIADTKNVAKIVINEANAIKDMSSQTHDISEGVSKAMEDIANGTMNQANELEKTAANMGDLSESINNIIGNVSNVQALSNETKEIGDESLSIVKKLKDKTNNTNKVMDDITSNIKVLTDSIKEIEQVIELIKGISEQTNLLSLNAGIEAARAGESGRGFAVVADEVKKLAEQSKESTDNVYKVIVDVYDKANSAINLIENSKKAFKEQTEAVEFTNNSFINIITSTDKITKEINNIGTLMNGVSDKKDETLSSTDSIKCITENSSANTEEVLASTEEQTANAENLEQSSLRLSNAVEQLEGTINKFKI